MNRVLMTGGTGCIGAATAYVLASRGVDEILIATSSAKPGSLGLWFGEAIDPRIKLVKTDVADADEVRRLVTGFQPSEMIHLGAFQSPDCEAYPTRGMEVNVGGTMNMLNAAAELKGTLERFVFASSAAVYGPKDFYPDPLIRETDTLAPPNLYGIWKVAGEHLARQFQARTGIDTISLRLNTTYGKGRDKGKTSAPTTAMKAVAMGIPYRMPYFRRENYHFVEDVAAHFASCALDPFEGYGVFNLRGQTMEVAEFLALIGEVANDLGMGPADLGIAPDATPASFACDLDDSAIQIAFPHVGRTPVQEGIRKTLLAFRQAKPMNA